MCSKVQIILYFVKQKCHSGNCYVSCFFTEKTPLLQEDYSGMLQIENIGTIKVTIGTSGWGCRNLQERNYKMSVIFGVSGYFLLRRQNARFNFQLNLMLSICSFLICFQGCITKK